MAAKEAACDQNITLSTVEFPPALPLPADDENFTSDMLTQPRYAEKKPATAGRHSSDEAIRYSTSTDGMKDQKNSVRRVGSIDVQATDQRSAISEIIQAVRASEPRLFSFCNAATVNIAHHDPAFAQVARSAVMFNDGVGLDLASLILYGAMFPQNLNGTDLIPALLQQFDAPVRLFLLGSLPDVAEQAGIAMAALNPQVVIAGTHQGYFDFSETDALVALINAQKPDLIIIGMGQPRQELWAASALAKLGVPCLCVGAFMDFASGRMPRAPQLVRAMRIEWLYRLTLEPRRLSPRYIGGALPYIARVLVQRFSAR